jgi:hypothetical protein
VIERLVLAGTHVLGGIDSHHSSVLLNTGSMSKITPRNGKTRWRTTSPSLNLAMRILEGLSGNFLAMAGIR